MQEFGREIKPIGSGDFYVLGEAPGEKEDRAGVPFIGSSGSLLFSVLASYGITRSQCRVANVFWRRPPRNDIEKAKKSDLWDFYAEETKKDILQSKPKIILALGSEALNLLFPDSSISSLRGYILDYKGTPVIPTWHPAAVLRYDQYLLSFKMDIGKAVRFYQGLISPLNPPTLSFSQEDFVYTIDKAISQDLPIALDIETTETSIYLIGLAVKENDQVLAISCPYDQTLAGKLREKLPKLKIPIFHNSSFDLSWLFGYSGISFSSSPHDTMLMHHLLLPDQSKSLEFCGSFWLPISPWKHLSESDQKTYNAYDCFITLELFFKLKETLQSAGHWEVYDQQKRQEILPAIFMGLLGVRLDEEERQRLLLEVREKQSSILQSISALDPSSSAYNLNSEKQLKEYLYGKLKIPPERHKGKLTTREDAIKKAYLKLKKKGDWRAEILSLYLEFKKLKSIESKELKVGVSSWTGRVHTEYKVDGTETARWSSKAPAWGNPRNKVIHGTNFQNRSKAYRSIYLPPFENWLFIGADYSGAEARIVAYRCNDEASIEAFEKGIDIHKLTASLMFQLPISEITPDLRKIGKTIRHAANYDMSWRKLADLMEIPASEAKDLLSRYHYAFPKIRSIFHEKTKEIISKERKLLDAWGLPRYFSGRLNSDTFREAYAFYPQSTCTHTLNKALLRLWDWSREKKYVAIQFQIHDEIILSCEPEAIDEVAHKLQEAMEIEIPILCLEDNDLRPLILPIEFKLGRNWGDMVEFKSLSELPEVKKQLGL